MQQTAPRTTGEDTPQKTILESTSVADCAPLAFSDAQPAEISDALTAIGRMTNRMPTNWAQPDKPVTIAPHDFGELVLAATGLTTVTELLMVLTSADLEIKSSVINGLAAAAVTLAGSIDSGLDRVQLHSST